MAPTVRTSAVFASTAGSASFTPSLTPQVGDLELLFAIVPSTRTITAPAGQGWATAYSSIPDRILYVFYRIPSSATQSGAFTISGAANAANAYAQLMIVGYDPTTPIGPANATADTSSNTNIVSPSLTPNAAPSLYATLFVAINPGTITLPGSMTGTGTGAGGASGYTVRGAWEALSGLSASGTRTATVSATGATEAVAVLIRPANVTPTGIASAEAFGTMSIAGGPVSVSPTGISSSEAFGTAAVVMGLVGPLGIASAETFGAVVVSPGPLNIAPAAGIGSAEAFGTARLTITLNPALRAARPKQSRPIYELVAIARVNQSSGKPTFLEVDPIEGWTSMAYTEQVSVPPQLNVGVKLTTLTEPVIQRLRALHELATEIRLYRNGRIVFQGPLHGYEVQSEALTFNAQGAMYYLRWMFVTSDMTFKAIDQFQIVKSLVDQWQNQAYGNFGIDTAGVGTSGVTRDATFLKTELHNVYDRVTEMGKRDNGFDINIDPTTRALQLKYPTQGVDRSSGSDAIVIDSASITNRNIVTAAGVNDIASEAFVTGTSNQTTVYAAKSNATLRNTYGRIGITDSFSSVSEQVTVDAHAQGLLNAHNAALMIPGPDVRVTLDADISNYNVGDTVQYQLHDRLGIRGAFRLRKRTVRVNSTGQENVTLEFA